MRRTLFGVALVSIVAWSTPTIFAFCGFYVAKADTKPAADSKAAADKPAEPTKN